MGVTRISPTDKTDKTDNPIGVCMENIYGFDERWLSVLSLYLFYRFICFICSLYQKRIIVNTVVTTLEPSITLSVTQSSLSNTASMTECKIYLFI